MSCLITAVLFDFGLVLSGPPNPVAWERMHRTLALEADIFHRRYWARRHDYDRGALTGEAYWREIAGDDRGHLLSAQTLDRLFASDVELWSDINQPMLEWARGLQRRGIKTGILSNMGDRMTEGLLRQLPWLNTFAHHTWSHALGVAKPEALIYEHAARGLQTQPSQILFIDDKPENIAAAREAGMQAVQYSTWPGFLAAMRENGFAALLDPGHLSLANDVFTVQSARQ